MNFVQDWGQRVKGGFRAFQNMLIAFLRPFVAVAEGLGELAIKVLTLIPFLVITLIEVIFGREQSYRQVPQPFIWEVVAIVLILVIYAILMAGVRRSASFIAWRVTVLLLVAVLVRISMWMMNTNPLAGLTPGGALNWQDSAIRVVFVGLTAGLFFVFRDFFANLGDKFGRGYAWVREQIFPLLNVLFQVLNWFNIGPVWLRGVIATVLVVFGGLVAAQLRMLGLFALALAILLVLWLIGRRDPRLNFNTPLAVQDHPLAPPGTFDELGSDAEEDDDDPTQPLPLPAPAPPDIYISPDDDGDPLDYV